MKILIVDDDIQIANFLKKALKNESFEVDVANDGDRGSFLARTNDYDIIVLDNAMPKKDGKTVCKEIRNDGVHIPILMLSVLSGPGLKAELLNAGADDYLTKPFSFEELVARIRALLRRSKDITKEIISIDNLEIDTKKQTVKRGGREIYLTLKEFMLLEYLMQHKGAVVSRGMILEHVWDMNADPFSNTIEAHVSNLRKKIDISGEKPLISTVSGRGYKIEI